MVLIILHHLFQQTSSFYNVNYPFLCGIFFVYVGYLATAVFFLISGYGLFFSLHRHSAISPKYILVHMLKLYLPFLFVWVVDMFIVILCENRTLDMSCFIDLLCFNFPCDSSILWFMKTIFGLYVVVFLIFKIFKNDNIRACVISGLVLMWVVLARFYLQYEYYIVNSILCFPLGLFCFLKRANIQKYNSSKYANITLVIFCVTFILSFITLPLVNQIISALMLSIYSIFFVSRVTLKNKILDFIGVNSICFYLYHCSFLRFHLSNIFYYLLLVVGASILLTLVYTKLYSTFLKDRMKV